MKLRHISLLLVIASLLIGLTSVLAQGGPSDDKPTPIDSYPLPSQFGAARYTLVDRWNRTDLTFYIHNCPGRNLDCGAAHDAVRAAFRAWDEVSALAFTQANSPAAADIELRWTLSEEEFGTPGDVLAFGFFPSYGGDVYFDDAEPWTLYDGGGTDFYVVAVHEIGHTLGLDHSDDTSAIMYAYSGYSSRLGPDDIAGIQRLYGADTGDTNVVSVEPPSQVPTGGGTDEVVDGSISSLQYYEWWTIDVVTGETVTLTMETTSGNLDTYLILLTPDGNTVLAEDDDSMGGTNSQLTYTFPSTDDYMIVATRYNTDAGQTEGTYRLSAFRSSVDTTTSTIPDNTVPSAGTVQLTIYNTSGTELCGIWFSPSSSDDWGYERLAGDVGGYLYNGYYFVWAVPADTYDFYVEDCYGGYLEQYYVDVFRATQIEVQATYFVIK